MLIKDFICKNEWKLGGITSAEALTLLQVVKFIYNLVVKDKVIDR